MNTRTFRLNKLVRDGVFKNMIELGQKPNFKKLNNSDLLMSLKNKIIEEGQEFDPKSKKAVRELADIAEMVEQLALKMGVSLHKLREVQLDRRKQVGVFDDGIFITDLELRADDPWAEYYAAEPKRFPEIK